MSAYPSDAFGLSVGLDHFFHPNLFCKGRISDTTVHFNPAVRESVVAKDSLLELATALGATFRDVQAAPMGVHGFEHGDNDKAVVRLELHSENHDNCGFTVAASSWSNVIPDPNIWKECVALDAGFPSMISKIYVRNNDPHEFLIPVAYGRRVAIAAMSFFLI